MSDTWVCAACEESPAWSEHETRDAALDAGRKAAAADGYAAFITARLVTPTVEPQHIGIDVDEILEGIDTALFEAGLCAADDGERGVELDFANELNFVAEGDRPADDAQQKKARIVEREIAEAVLGVLRQHGLTVPWSVYTGIEHHEVGEGIGA